MTFDAFTLFTSFWWWNFCCNITLITHVWFYKLLIGNTYLFQMFYTLLKFVLILDAENNQMWCSESTSRQALEASIQACDACTTCWECVRSFLTKT